MRASLSAPAVPAAVLAVEVPEWALSTVAGVVMAGVIALFTYLVKQLIVLSVSIKEVQVTQSDHDRRLVTLEGAIGRLPGTDPGTWQHPSAKHKLTIVQSQTEGD